MKGIVLAGGTGTRLYPITQGISKQLLPIYDKPMIYYPISVLMLAGISEIIIITTPGESNTFKTLLGDGSNFGLKFEFLIQKDPNGIAEAFIIAQDHILNESVCLILGDNIFHGSHFSNMLAIANTIVQKDNKAVVFTSTVEDPKRYGVLNIDSKGNITSIEEKPEDPKSDQAVTGLYFYPKDVVSKALSITPSERGELEITDLNNLYLNESKLHAINLGRGFGWLDTGTPESLFDAIEYVRSIQRITSKKIACLEEIGLKRGLIERSFLEERIKDLKGEYYDYLRKLKEIQNYYE